MALTEDELIPTRATLIHRLKNWEDQTSWQEFFDVYWKLIYGVARQGGLTEMEAQDVVQETMVSVAKHMPAFKYDPAIGSFKTWLLNMTRWRMADQLRKRSQIPGLSPVHDESVLDALDNVADSAGVNLEKVWDVEWENNLLEAAIAKARRRLDPQKYQIFDFCVNKGWDVAKVAEAFSISADQVYLDKHRVARLIKE
jgi:RNA polymerase sigma-70 factor (ECF subfamily)